MSLIDLSKPYLITERAARFYIGVYRDVLRRKASGEDIQVANAKPIVKPKTVRGREGASVPIGGVDMWGDPIVSDWTSRDGVATIDCIGPVIRYGGWLAAYSGLCSTGNLALQLQQTLDNSEVRAIILNVDSPGGEGNGIAELADTIRAATAQKPIVAYIDGLGCSAGYWLASACEEIVCSSTAMVGSIGTIMAWIDDAKALEMEGLEEITFVSSQSPLKKPDPKSDEGRAAYQTTVDDFTQIFGESVARFRGVSTETVFSDFGRGDVFIGQKAVDAGLCDRVGSYERLHDEMARLVAERSSFGFSPSSSAQNLMTTAPQVLIDTKVPRGAIMSEHKDETKIEETNAEETRDETQSGSDVDDVASDVVASDDAIPESDPPVVDDAANESDNAEPASSTRSQTDAPSVEAMSDVQLRTELQRAQTQLASQDAQLRAQRRDNAKSARENFAASLSKKVPKTAQETFSTLYSALQNGTATTSHLEAVVAAMPQAALFSGIDADVTGDLAPVAPPAADDPYAKDVEATKAFVARNNRKKAAPK